ncbi:MAG: lytic transglycosylase domain-containing protein [Deltaproteobacteria bacterium]|nr:lytic transglycosylase domain-containing protein [Deltaproteobacteria bacterium]
MKLVFLFIFLYTLAINGFTQSIYQCIEDDGSVIFTDRKGKNCTIFIKVSKNKVVDRQIKFVKPSKIDPKVYDSYISEAARTFNLPEYLIRAVIAVESSYNPYAISPKGAEGLMQLMPSTAKDMEVKDSFDPRENIMGGARYLRFLANMFNGDLVLILAAYNAGHAAVKKYGNKVPPYQETIDYVKRVSRLYLQFKEEYKKKQEKIEASSN